ncbi:hypothetical protein [Methanococcoides methylutens]|uniref:Uncharacterized protein n=1 Tax=Methanococcoides methylutens MM1 TaxID=1434104 RepID=A0A0E3SS94_METMT|nr:hypothetical protein [Methanococcoides methylutens]AKB85217.1 hypothetical protein MCMEM_1164 [Methanococcoides methylutens MM1]
MSDKRSHILSLLLVCFVMAGLVFTAGCISDENISEDESAGFENILFLDHHINSHGEFIEGDTWPMLAIDFPTYYFDEENQALHITAPREPFEVNSSLMMIAGDGSSLSGVIGMGAGTMTYAAYSLPHEVNSYEVISISKEGTVVISYNDEEIVIEAGEKWENIENTTEESEEGQPYAKVNITTTDTFINYGFLEKGDIVFDNF